MKLCHIRAYGLQWRLLQLLRSWQRSAASSCRLKMFQLTVPHPSHSRMQCCSCWPVCSFATLATKPLHSRKDLSSIESWQTRSPTSRACAPGVHLINVQGRRKQTSQEEVRTIVIGLCRNGGNKSQAQGGGCESLHLCRQAASRSRSVGLGSSSTVMHWTSDVIKSIHFESSRC